MPAMTNILVKDDAVTEFTLQPVTDTPNPLWRGVVPNVPISGQIQMSFMSQKLKAGYKLTVKLEVPVMETLGASGTSAGYVAPPKVAYVTTGIFSMFIDSRSTIADRANALKMMVGILQGASSVTATGTNNQAHGAGHWAAQTTPASSFFNTLSIPN